VDKYVLISILMKQAIVSSGTPVQCCQAKCPHILKKSNFYRYRYQDATSHDNLLCCFEEKTDSDQRSARNADLIGTSCNEWYLLRSPKAVYLYM